MNKDPAPFTRPLEVFEEQRSGRFFTHPNAPGELIRRDGFFSVEEASRSARYAAEELADLEWCGLDHVRYSQVIGEGDTNDPYLYTVMERLDNAESFGQYRAGVPMDQQAVVALDHAAASMAQHISNVIERGGLLSPEFTRLDQCMVDRSDPAKARAVMVDVEPIGSQVIPAVEAKNGDDRRSFALHAAVSNLAHSMLEVQQLSGAELSSIGAVRALAASLPSGNGIPAQVQFKRDLCQAIDENSLELINELMYQDEDDDDAYWARYCAENPYGAYSIDFVSDEALRHYIVTGER